MRFAGTSSTRDMNGANESAPSIIMRAVESVGSAAYM